ncbi:MAG: RagB/SusD family nutrient uptake outer membrane protein [Gemmatimonadota bacterium]
MMKFIKNNMRWPRTAVLVVLAGMATSACDVVNPGRILDADLSQEGALRVLVNGIGGDVTLAYRGLGWNLEVLTGGLTGTSAYDSRIRHWRGNPNALDAEDYNSAWAAGWVADQGIARMQEVLGGEFNNSALAAEAYVWGGIAYRLLGESMCQAVFDGGAPTDRSEYLERAEEYFTSAAEIASAVGNSSLRNAALGGRASVRINLGDWQGAVADAQQVPTAYEWAVIMHGGDTRERNEIFYENQRRTNLNVRYSFFHSYGEEFDDPRADIVIPTDVGAADGSFPQVWHTKYTAAGDDVPAVKGTEMRLIEAEYYITQTGEWQRGLDIVNQLRADAGVAPWTASNQAEAFTALKKERAIVLWLEHRRGGDLYRWGNTAAGDPVLAKMYENVAQSDGHELAIPQGERAICLPFSQTLVSTNPNIS